MMRLFAGPTSFAVIAALSTGHAAVQGSKGSHGSNRLPCESRFE